LSDPLAESAIAVIGFGHQGEAQAENLRAAGIGVLVGARPGHEAEARARARGFTTTTIEDAAARARVVAILLPDEVVPSVWPVLVRAMKLDAALVFAHGFNLQYGDLSFPERADVVLVSPTAPGTELLRVRARGETLPAYLAVHRDVSGAAWELAESYARRIGCGPLLRTTVREETEVDLFGEQTVLCGGMNALVRSAFEILVENGYAPEIAYLECVHQLKYLADLLHDRGMEGFRRAISGTALFGDLTRGPRVIGEATRTEMRRILEEIRSGAFAREWRDEVAGGKRWLDDASEKAAHHPLERARKSALEHRPDPDPPDPKSRNAMSKN